MDWSSFKKYKYKIVQLISLFNVVSLELNASHVNEDMLTCNLNLWEYEENNEKMFLSL